MKLFKFYFEIFFFIFIFIRSSAFANNIQFDGLSKLTVDDIQSLTSVDIYKQKISEIDIDFITKDLYQSDLIYDLDLYIENNTFFFSIIENDIIENIYINGNVRIKDKQILSIIESKLNFYLNKDTLKTDIS